MQKREGYILAPSAFINLSGHFIYIKRFKYFLDTVLSSFDESSGKIPMEIATPVTDVVGPSHVIRWNWHVRDRVVHANLPADRMFGIGGAPIWSERLFNVARQAVAEGGTIGMMVGDFRFGNGIALRTEDDTASLFQDGYLGIDARAMTPDVDRRMQERGLAAVKVWHEVFSGKVRFVFWDLFGRQVHDRLAGRHIGEGRYLHPVFNYSETVAQFMGANIVDLSPLLRSPMHEVKRLFIDASCHPSQIGYFFLNDVLCKGRDVTESYHEAVNAVEEDLFVLASKIVGDSGGPVLLTGRSIWLDTLFGYMGKSGVSRLVKEGLILAPLDRMPGQQSIEQLLQEVPFDRCTCVIVSAQGRDLSPQLARAFSTTPSFWRDVSCIDWETATIPAITVRGETPRHAYAGCVGPWATNVIKPDLSAHMVEQGPLGMPSWTGLRRVLECIPYDKLNRNGFAV